MYHELQHILARHRFLRSQVDVIETALDAVLQVRQLVSLMGSIALTIAISHWTRLTMIWFSADTSQLCLMTAGCTLTFPSDRYENVESGEGRG